MATSLTTITNVSKQVIPILVNDIEPALANPAATIPANQARQLSVPPSSQTVVETQRVDLGQLERLQQLRVITFSSA